MSLPHAILGFLQIQPLTGYDLKNVCFDQSIAHFWPADQAQIYRTLDKLAEQGWVESQLEVQEDRPNRKIYSITEAGRAELAIWLGGEQSLPVHREPFLIQLFFAAQMPDTEILRMMEAQLAAHEALLSRYQQIDIPATDNAMMARYTTFQGMTLDVGKRIEQMYIAWLQECIATVKQMGK